ncbi:MAG: GntR family transcriptional regulator [Sphaerochaeta sp.]|nr:GntR family transcriptional regulator [Sphaerochaeta sp.]
MKKIEMSVPMSAQVADEIRKGILSGEFRAGQKISVNSLCKVLGVSATPVKEAFKILQAEGLLVVVPRSGTIISSLARDNLQNIEYIRASLEGVAVYLATKIITDEQLEALEQLLQKSTAAAEAGDIETMASCNTEFHKGLRHASRNHYLIALINQVVSVEYSFRKSALKTADERLQGMKEHYEILKQMQARDADAAEQAIIRHIRRTASHVISEKFEK